MPPRNALLSSDPFGDDPFDAGAAGTGVRDPPALARDDARRVWAAPERLLDADDRLASGERDDVFAFAPARRLACVPVDAAAVRVRPLLEPEPRDAPPALLLAPAAAAVAARLEPPLPLPRDVAGPLREVPLLPLPRDVAGPLREVPPLPDLRAAAAPFPAVCLREFLVVAT
jgi:hypothetical protein